MKESPAKTLSTSNFSELRTVLAELPGPDNGAASKAEFHWEERVKPVGSLGMLEDSVVHCARWQHDGPRLNKVQILIYAGNHMIAKHGVSAYPADVTKAMIGVMQRQKAAVANLAKENQCDLRVFEMNLDQPVKDSTIEVAMNEEEAANAMCFGMYTVESNVDCVCLGEVGIGNTTAAAALVALHFPDHEPAKFVGRGTGLNDEQWKNKVKVVEKIVDRHRGARGLDALAAVGGREMAAIAGAIIAARMGKTVVLLDGYVVCAAALALHAEADTVLDHCLAGHCSAEAGHAHVLKEFGLHPLLDLNLRLGEGSGAALAVGLLRSGLACYRGMGSLREVMEEEKKG